MLSAMSNGRRALLVVISFCLFYLLVIAPRNIQELKISEFIQNHTSLGRYRFGLLPSAHQTEALTGGNQTDALSSVNQTQSLTSDNQTQALASVNQTEVLTSVNQTEALIGVNQTEALTSVNQTEALTSVNHTLDDILSELDSYTTHIKEIGDEILSSYESRPIQPSSTLVNAYDNGFFDKLASFPSVQTVFFQKDLEEMKKKLVPVYYEYASNNCELIEKHTGYDSELIAMYNNSCSSNHSVLLNGHGIMEKNMRVGLPYNFSHSPGAETWTYLHVIQNALVTTNGDVLTNNVTVIPQRCHPETRERFPWESSDFIQYDEVFSVHQYWDTGFYHSSMEGIPRIAPYVKLLNDNPQIKINLHSDNHLVQSLGIRDFDTRRLDNQRFRAKVLYSPAGGPCGRSPLFASQLLSLYARRDLENNPKQRNKIILIKRSTSRFFKKHNAIAEMLKKEAVEHGLELFVFNDRPLPSLQLTKRMFNEAIMIVAPHGAGESNIVYSQPGTVLIEGLCWEVPHRVILCYRNAAQILGLRYYALFFNKGCFDVTADEVKVPVTFFLQHLDFLKNS